MRKLMLASLCLLLSLNVTLKAQTDETKGKKEQRAKIMAPEQEEQDPPRGKKGQLILPEAGDYNIGVNIIPFFNWLGNSFNASQNNTYASSGRFFSVFGATVLQGRYMLKDNAALRVNFGINVNITTNSAFLPSDHLISGLTVEDTRTMSGGTYAIGIGYEKRRGKGRIQGYYGIDVLLKIEHTGGASYTYGNDFSFINAAPSSTNWGTNILAGGLERVLQDGARLNASIGVRPFLGIEYFVAPKVSIGGEFGWGISYSTVAPYTRTVEFFDHVTNEVSTRSDRTGSGGRFNAGLDNLGGAILLNFYF